MRMRRVVGRILGLALLPAVTSGCVNDVVPSAARVVVEANPASPLELVVSKAFDVMVVEEGEKPEAVLLTADTLPLTGNFDETFDITALRRIYVEVRNDEEEQETVRVRVYLDRKLFFDSTDRIADGRNVEYFFTSHSFR